MTGESLILRVTSIRNPPLFFVEAVDDSTIIQLSFEKEQKLYESIPKFERFFRLHAQRTASALQKGCY
jgi:hypothetical protein